MKDPTKNAVALRPLAQGLSAVAPHLEPKEADQAAAALTQAMKDPKNAAALGWLARGLSAVAPRLEPKEAAEAAAALTQAMKDPKNAVALGPLAQGLSAVAARMEPKEAAAALTPGHEGSQERKRHGVAWRRDCRRWPPAWSPKRLPRSPPHSHRP